MRKSTYIILTLICIVIILLIQSLVGGSGLSSTDSSLSFSKEEILKSPQGPLISIIALGYFLLLLLGLINLIIFSFKKLNNKPIVNFPKQVFNLGLGQIKIYRIFFLISFLVLIIHSLVFVVSSLNLKFNALNLLLIFNALIQLGVLIILVTNINYKKFGLKFSLEQLKFLLKIYTITIPLLLLAIALNIYLLKIFGIENSLSPAIEILFLTKNYKSLLVLSIQIVFLGPLVEELFFRGFLFSLIRKNKGFLLSASLTSLAFSLLHRAPGNLLPLFVISCSLCYVYERTKSISAPIIFHALHNLINLLLFFIIKNLI